MIIKEQNFMEQMERIVEPYLAKRRKESFLERDSGRNIFCAFYQADEPDGIVLISHGFTETADKYHELAYYFLKAGFHVCVPEHLGHGRSSRLVEDPSFWLPPRRLRVSARDFPYTFSDIPWAAVLPRAPLPARRILSPN